MGDLKFGKLPAQHRHDDLRFRDYKTTSISPAPIGFGHDKLVTNPWGMLGNDQWGDCACAGPAHETMLWNAAAGKQVQFTTANVLDAYSAITGFNENAGPPGENPTDQGSNVGDVLSYRRSTGFTDSTGENHKILGWVALEPGNWKELLQALYVFEAVGIGIQVPETAETQFGQGKPWTYVPGAQIVGGHYVPVQGRVAISEGKVITWGAEQVFTRAFYEHYCDEAYGILSAEMLDGVDSLEDFDLAALQADLSEL